MADVSALTIRYLALLKRHLPELTFHDARLLPASGQFNHVLSLDERWIFRFPKSAHVAADLEHELRILPRLQGLLPLAIPEPEFSARDSESGLLLFMAYRMLPGQPLLRERFAEIQHEDRVLERIASDLAGFLRRLHAIPPATMGLAAQPHNTRGEWLQTYRAIRAKLFPHMRAEAQREVARQFDDALADSTLWDLEACLIHGDFGTGNILFQDGRISGIIDFSFCKEDDPAQDLGALIASYGDDFAERVCRHYPGLRGHWRRAQFYCGAYALLQALYALRDGDQAEFEDGIAQYR